MKCAIISFLVLFFCNAAFAQQFTLSTNTYTQVAYIGYDNQISCTVEGVNTKSIVLTTDNGEIVKMQKYFMYHPARVSDSKIIIHQKHNGQLRKIGEQAIMIREFPDPKITIGGFINGEISKGNLLAQTGIGCYYSIPGLGFNLKCRIDSFSIIVLRDSVMLYHRTNKGYLFTDETMAFLESIKKGDVIIISEITYLTPDQRKKKANPIEYTID